MKKQLFVALLITVFSTLLFIQPVLADSIYDVGGGKRTVFDNK